MAELFIIAVPDGQCADAALVALRRLQGQVVADGVVVERKEGQELRLEGHGVTPPFEQFWLLLIRGLVSRIEGGSASGADPALTAAGLDADLMAEMASYLRPGRSIVFALMSGPAAELVDHLQPFGRDAVRARVRAVAPLLS